MSRFLTLGYRLPIFSKVLFGDREKFGRIADRDDPMWAEWEQVCSEFYVANQRSGIGERINNSGYKILRQFDFTGKTIVEIGPGKAPHLPFFDTKPDRYILIDIRAEFLAEAKKKIEQLDIACETVLIDTDRPSELPVETGSIDAIVSFYSLEHLHPLTQFVREYHRILKTDGHFIGAIPAEGGLAWGLGRYLTTRRWLKRNTNIDPDKLICWEHPNFSDEILRTISGYFDIKILRYFPLSVPSADMNLVISIIGKRKTEGLPE